MPYSRLSKKVLNEPKKQFHYDKDIDVLFVGSNIQNYIVDICRKVFIRNIVMK
jgi:hypothetical protein